MYFVMAEVELMPLCQSETITGLEEVCDEYCRPVDILSAWRSKLYVVFIELLICLYCISHSILYCTEIIKVTFPDFSLFPAGCQKLSLFFPRAQLLWFSVSFATHKMWKGISSSISQTCCCSGLCRIVVTEVPRWDWQMSPGSGLERHHSPACSSALSDLDTFKKEEFAKVVAVLWFWFVLSL